MSYFILGSNSFAGSTYVNELLTAEQEVIGVSRSELPHAALTPFSSHRQLKNYTFYQWDLNQHFEQIKAIIVKHQPRYIIDFASQSMVTESWQYPTQWYQTNIVAKVKLHDFLRNCDFLERYIRISTPEVYGHSDKKITEDQSFNPTTPYAVSQAACDMSLMAFYKQYQFPVIFTRFANFYGAYQQFYRIIPKTIIYGLLNKKLPLHGGGTSKRAFIYGTDVATAISAVISKGKIGESYHFSTGDCITIADTIKMICDLLTIRYEQLVEIASERPGKDFQYFMDTKKAETELAWKSSISLEEGLKKTIIWIEKHINEIKNLPLDYIHKA